MPNKIPRIGIDAREVYAPRPRGVGKTLLELLRAMLRLETNYEFFLYFETGNQAGQFSILKNVKEVAMDMKGARFNLWEHVRLPLAVGTDRIDLFHCTSPIASFVFPSPMVVTIHDLIPLKIGDGWSAQSINRFQKEVARSIKKAKKIITISNYTKQDVLETFKVAEDKIEVIYWAPGEIYTVASQERIAELRNKYKLEAPYFLSFGGGSPRKNVKRLVEAFSQFKKADRNEHQLVVIGMPERQREEMQKLCADLSIEKHLVWHGYFPEEDTPALLGAAQALVYVPLYEGFGVPVLEAMACGTAIIASNVTSLPEIAEDAAYYVDPYNTGDIAEALQAVSRNDRFCNQLIERGKKRVLDFSWEKTAHRVMNVYTEALY